VFFVPFIIANPAAYRDSFNYQNGRGLQLESVPSGLIFAGIINRSMPAVVKENDHRALGVHVPRAGAIIRTFEEIFIGFYALLLGLYYRALKRHSEDAAAIDADLVNYAILSGILLFLITAKILSPQYMIWLIPFVPLIRHPCKWMIFPIVIFTAYIYPLNYVFLELKQPDAVFLLNLRNLTLAIFFIMCMWRLYVLGRLPSNPPSISDVIEDNARESAAREKQTA
jgi:hypothetical protein